MDEPPMIPPKVIALDLEMDHLKTLWEQLTSTYRPVGNLWKDNKNDVKKWSE